MAAAGGSSQGCGRADSDGVIQSATYARRASEAQRQELSCLGLSWAPERGDPLFRAIVQRGAFEPDTTKLLFAACKPGMVVLDVGANVGWYSALLAQRVGETGRVVAFEPLPECRRELKQNLLRNGLAARVTVLPFGLSDEDGKRAARCLETGVTLHFEANEEAELCEVAVRRLDDVVVEQGLPKVDVIKIDVDGHELQVLRGAQNLLRRDRPVVSLVFGSPHPHGEHGGAKAQLAFLHDLHYELCDERTGMPFASDEEFYARCDEHGPSLHVVAMPVEKIAGLPVRLHETLDDLRASLDLVHTGSILECDIDTVENDCELWGRKRRDAEVLTTVAANAHGNCLDLGTSHGRSAYELATNVGPKHTVFTVNMLPEHAASAGVLVTHVLQKHEIGSYFRERGIDNVTQVYADTSRWTPAPEIRDLAAAFVDACHDADAVRRDSHLAWERLRVGGFLLWHDFSPVQRHRHAWIRTSMQGVAQFLKDVGHRGPVHHLRGSWIGLVQKAHP